MHGNTNIKLPLYVAVYKVHEYVELIVVSDILINHWSCAENKHYFLTAGMWQVLSFRSEHPY